MGGLQTSFFEVLSPCSNEGAETGVSSATVWSALHKSASAYPVQVGATLRCRSASEGFHPSTRAAADLNPKPEAEVTVATQIAVLARTESPPD